MTDRILPEYDRVSPDDMIQAVYMALGAASMCWSETPKGVFDSTLAKQIGEELLEIIDSYGYQNS